MYPVSIGFGGAVQRINALVTNGHDAESLVTAAFTVEKTLRRTLRQIILSAGFPSSISDKIVRSLGGLEKLRSSWEIYDPRHRKLAQLITKADWDIFTRAAQMRNELVHGVRVYDLVECRAQTAAVLAALHRLKALLDQEYGYSGWERARIRKKSTLHSSPLVTWTR